MNGNIDHEYNGASDATESGENISVAEFIQIVRETRGGLFGINKKQALKIIMDISDDTLRLAIPTLKEDLDTEIRQASMQPPFGGGIITLGDANKINNLRVILEVIRERLGID